MTEVRVNGVYVAKRVYSGKNESGKWEILLVQNVGRKQPKIAISVKNIPSHIGPNGVFRLTKIHSVQHRMWNNHGHWEGGSVTVRANVKALPNIDKVEMTEEERKAIESADAPEFPGLEDFFK